MINNVEKIREFLSFDDNDFYIIEIIKRRKDNPGLPKSEKLIKHYYVDSLDYFDRIISEIIDLCNQNIARGYFRVNKRNYKDLGLHVASRVINYIQNNNFKLLPKAFDHVAGEFHSDKDKKWIVDVDYNGLLTVNDLPLLKYDLNRLQVEAKNDPMIQEIPTVNGVHLITRPFNLKNFKQFYPEIDVHKDNLTLIYYP